MVPETSTAPPANAARGFVFLHPMARPTLSVREVHELLAAANRDHTLAQTRWSVTRWRARGWPLVTEVPGRGKGGVQLRVDAAELEAMLRGELSELPLAA